MYSSSQFNICLGGDPRSEFMIGEDGNVILAKQLSAEIQKNYTLKIRVTDGVHDSFTQVSFFLFIVLLRIG